MGDVFEWAGGWVGGELIRAERLVCTLFLRRGWAERVTCVFIVLAGVLGDVVCPNAPGGGAYCGTPAREGGLVS